MTISQAAMAVCIGFAIYYIAFIIRNLDGPFYAFFILRKLIGFKYEETDIGVAETIPDNFFGQLLACQYCLYFWMSIGIHLIDFHNFNIIAVLTSCGVAAAILRGSD